MEKQRLKKWIAILLITVILPLNSFIQVRADVLAQKVFTDDNGKYTITVNETNVWEDGYIAEITIKNTGNDSIKNWSVNGTLHGEISNIWNAQIVKQKEDKIILGYKRYNRTIAKGGEITFGLKVKNGSFEAIDSLLLLEDKEYKTTAADISYQITNSWDKHAVIEATVHNSGKTVIRDWKAVFDLDAEITNIWNAQILHHEAGRYVLGNKEYNALIDAGETITFGFQVTYKEDTDVTVPEDSVLYAVSDAERVEDKDAERIDWYKAMINADDASVVKARETVNHTVKVAVLDSGVDYTESVDVAERVNFVEDYEETNPLFNDLSGHGTGVAGMISSVTELEEEVEEDENENEADIEELDFSFLDVDDNLDYKEGDEVELEDEEDEETEEASDSSTEETEALGKGEEETEEKTYDEDSFFAANYKYGEVEGLNNYATLYSVRVLDEQNNAPVERVIKGIEWAIDKQVNIINLSWGTDVDNPALHKVIKKAYDKGILIIAAAGNDKNIMYPARYDEVMAAGSVDSQGRHVKDSAMGEQLEVVAPAEDVTCYTSFGVLSTMTGSSIAAPQVTALAAILWQQNGDVSARFIRQLIDITATNLGEKKEYGYGLINYKEAVAYYDEFLAAYEEKQTVEENEAAAVASGSPVPETDVSIVRDGYVKGLWNEDGHQAIVEKNVKNLNFLKEGIIWPDKEESGLKSMSSHPYFHGGHKKNYVEAYVYMTTQAAYYYKEGMWKEGNDNKNFHENFITSLKNYGMDASGEAVKPKKVPDASGEAVVETMYDKIITTNEEEAQEIKERHAYFAYGMAFHTMGDTFAHASWGVDGDKHSEYKKNEENVLNIWERIVHGAKNGNNSYIDARADNTSVVPERYAYACYVVTKAIENIAQKHKAGDAYDFISDKKKFEIKNNSQSKIKEVNLSIPLGAGGSKITRKREKYIENHFGIIKLKEYIKEVKGEAAFKQLDAGRLKILDSVNNASIKKQLSEKWQKVTINIGRKVKWKEGSTCEVYRVVKKNGVENYKTIKTVKKGKKYCFIGNIGAKYIIQCTSVDDMGKRLYATKWMKLKKGNCDNPKDASVMWENEKVNVPRETLYSAVKPKITKKMFKSRTKVSGLVIHGGTDKELKGVKVTVTDVNNDKNSYSVRTNKKGMYYLKKKTNKTTGKITDNRLCPGVYKMKFHKKGFKDEIARITVKSNQSSLTFTTVVMFPASEKGTGTVKGKVSDMVTGAGVKGLTLSFRRGINMKKGKVCEKTTTTDNGKYQVSGLECGNYTVKIEDKRKNVSGDRYLTGYMNVLVTQKKKADQNGVVGKKQNKNQIRIVLTWGDTPNDLDSHLYGKSCEGKDIHISYENKVHCNSAKEKEAVLDVDDTSKYGPETTTVYNPVKNDYTFCVYNYSHGNAAQLKKSGAEVRVYRGNSNEPLCNLYVPNSDGYCWNVFTYNGSTKKVTPANTITNALP